MKTLGIILLFVISNTVMTFAWYWHLKPSDVHIPLWKVILISWLIAGLEYCFVISANHYGAELGIKPFQLKIMNEVITLVVFTFFAIFYLKESWNWNYLISFVFILAAVYFAMRK